MTYWNGFITGVIVGFFATLVATGHISILELGDVLRSICILVLFIIFVFGLALTIYQAKYRKSFFNPTVDGFITGMGWIEAIIIFLLYGFKI